MTLAPALLPATGCGGCRQPSLPRSCHHMANEGRDRILTLTFSGWLTCTLITGSAPLCCPGKMQGLLSLNAAGGEEPRLLPAPGGKGRRQKGISPPPCHHMADRGGIGNQVSYSQTPRASSSAPSLLCCSLWVQGRFYLVLKPESESSAVQSCPLGLGGNRSRRYQHRPLLPEK